MAKNDPTSKISSIDVSFNLNILLLMHTLYMYCILKNISEFVYVWTLRAELTSLIDSGSGETTCKAT